MISIIVPVYNVEKYLKKCIDSLLNQSYKNLQIILVDDGSTDKSGEICNTYLKSDNRIEVYHKKNGGLSDARNFGLKKVKGDLIFFIDSDDYLDEKTIEIMYDKMIKSKSDIVICGFKSVYENGELIKQSKIKEEQYDCYEATRELIKQIKFEVSAGGKLYKKNLWNNEIFPVGKKNEDIYIMHKIFLKSKKVLLLENNFYYYVQRENSISRNKNINLESINAGYKRICDLKKSCPNMVNDAIISYMFLNLWCYKEYYKYNVKCPIKTKKMISHNIRKNIYVIFRKNSYYLSKKIELSLCSINLDFYILIYKILKGAI